MPRRAFRATTRAVVAFLALAVGLLAAAAIAAADGEPDKSFGGDGLVDSGLGAQVTVSRPLVALTPGGGGVTAVCGESQAGCDERGFGACNFRGEEPASGPGGLRVLRLTAAGAPFTGTADDGWDANGQALVSQVGGEVVGLVVLADGRILVVLDQEDALTLVRLGADGRSEEHTSELQSRQYLVC